MDLEGIAEHENNASSKDSVYLRHNKITPSLRMGCILDPGYIDRDDWY